MQTIIVSDKPQDWAFAKQFCEVIDANEYILSPSFKSGKYHNQYLRVVNTCENYKYNQMGYYVSLLAQARGHKIYPTPMTIEDVNNATIATIISETMHDDIQKALKNIKSKEFTLSIYFGKNIAKQYDGLCKKLHGMIPFPLFRVHFKFHHYWYIRRILPINIADVPEGQIPFLQEETQRHFEKKRIRLHNMPVRHYEIAVLYNPNEQHAPSNKLALEKFVKAAENLNMDATLITRDDIKTLPQYDGLFIRETTGVNHHTYQFSRRGLAEGLVVVDDPNSILRCCNKVYLSDLLQKNNIPTPQTHIITEQNWREQERLMVYPCVLKKPDSAFSQGVIKVENKHQFADSVNEFLKHSKLIISQAYVPTEYDWRVGVFDNRIIYACKYFMAKDHWQIYNWESKDESDGNHITLPAEEVPPHVAKAALAACKLIGDNLYGVDIKEINQKAYVIEVNDNPNIDHGVEDDYLGDSLYHGIMETFYKRIRKKHGHTS